MSGTRLVMDKSFINSLKELLELVKNPKAIETAYKLALEKSALTNSEKEKLEEAKKFIASYEQLKLNLEKDKEKYYKDLDVHNKEIEIFKTSSENVKKEIDEKLIKLTKEEEKLRLVNDKYLDNVNIFNQEILEFQKNRKLFEEELSNKEISLSELKNELIADKKELTKQQDELKNKLDKLKSIAG